MPIVNFGVPMGKHKRADLVKQMRKRADANGERKLPRAKYNQPVPQAANSNPIIMPAKKREAAPNWQADYNTKFQSGYNTSSGPAPWVDAARKRVRADVQQPNAHPGHRTDVVPNLKEQQVGYGAHLGRRTNAAPSPEEQDTDGASFNGIALRGPANRQSNALEQPSNTHHNQNRRNDRGHDSLRGRGRGQGRGRGGGHNQRND
jgi:hypothetical protein